MMKNPLELTRPPQAPADARGNRRREAERDTDIAAWIAQQVDAVEATAELRLPPPVNGA